MIITITGMLGSGKTTVAKIFEDLGANIISADCIGHELLKREEIKRQLVETFSETILEKGAINRKKLAEIAFKTKENNQILNKITHPELISEIKKRIIPDKINIIDAALYHELELYRLDDINILVNTKQQIISKRIKNNFSERARFQKKIKAADYHIDNNSSVQETKEQVRKIWRQL